MRTEDKAMWGTFAGCIFFMAAIIGFVIVSFGIWLLK